MIEIKEFDSFYQPQVVEHILDIENNEFNMNLTLEMQPDLVDIHHAYKHQSGNFWIATDNNVVVGTIGIYNLQESIAELRRMFVKPAYRGKEHGIGQKMLDITFEWSKGNGYSEIFLETTEWLAAASMFYEKNNFKLINRDDLPSNFPLLRTTGKFMNLKLPKP